MTKDADERVLSIASPRQGGAWGRICIIIELLGRVRGARCAVSVYCAVALRVFLALMPRRSDANRLTGASAP